MGASCWYRGASQCCKCGSVADRSSSEVAALRLDSGQSLELVHNGTESKTTERVKTKARRFSESGLLLSCLVVLLLLFVAVVVAVLLLRSNTCISIMAETNVLSK